MFEITANYLKNLNCDIKSNWGNWKVLFIVFCYRTSRFLFLVALKTKILWLIAFPFLVLYRILIEWILGVEIPWACKIGPGLIIDHGQGLVINKEVVIGACCRLRNGVVIGCKVGGNGQLTRSPRIGNNVDIGACAIIIGDISIGDDSRIGAGAVVVKDVPSRAVVAGNPAKIIRMLGA